MPINLNAIDPGWKKPFSSPFTTRNLCVRPFGESDRKAAYGLLGQQEIYRFTPDLDNARQGLRWFDHICGKRSHLVLSLFLNTKQQLVGLVILSAESAQDFRLGGFLDPNHWGQGLAGEFLAGLLEKKHGPYRIHADTDPNNRAAKRLLESCGFWETCARHSQGIEYLWQVPNSGPV